MTKYDTSDAPPAPGRKGAPMESYDDEISLLPLIRTLWGYRRFIGAALGAIVILYLMAAVTAYLRQPAERHASLEFRLDFDGADRGEYPNGLKFSRSEIISSPVVSQVYEVNDLRRYGTYEQFKSSVFIIESSQDLELLSREYQAKLADTRLSAVDRSRLEAEFRQKTEALRESQYTLNFMSSSSGANIPGPLMNKILNDILAIWAEDTANRKGALNYQVRVYTPNLLTREVEEADDDIVRIDILRGKTIRVLENLDELLKLPGASVIRVGDAKMSLPEVRANLEDIARFRLEPLASFVQTAGLARDSRDATRYLENRLFQVKLERQEAAGLIAMLQGSLRGYMTERGAAQPGAREDAAGAASPLPGTSAVIPQFGESFLDRLLAMSSQNNDLQYRQNLTDRIIAAGERSNSLAREESYYESVIAAVRRLPSGGVPRTSGGSLDQTVQVQFTQIHDAVNEALEQANAVYAQLSTQNLNPRTNLYTISSPFRVTTVRALTTRTLAFYGVLVVALALVAVPLGCVVHHYVRTDLLAEVPPSHARAPSPEQSHDHGSGVR